MYVCVDARGCEIPTRPTAWRTTQCVRALCLLCRYELGGEDSAILNSSANALCQIPGFLCAPVELLLRRYTGSWAAIYALGSGSYLLTSILYARSLTQRPARELLQSRR
jgi:hypothetical protein